MGVRMMNAICGAWTADDELFGYLKALSEASHPAHCAPAERASSLLQDDTWRYVL